MRLPSFRTISLASLAVGLAALAPAALAADKIKVGYLSTLSGPNAQIGFDVRDGFNLAIKMNGGKLGTLPAEVIIADDQLNPDTGKQAVDRMLRRDRVDIVTGIIFSNVAVAVGPTIFESKTIYLSPNASPSQWAGAQCNPWFFSVSWPNESYHEAAGQYATDKGIKNVMFLAPNYPGGRDAATGFKRLYKGKVADEIYTKLGQLDYAAELAQIRAAKPEAMYVFLPGGMGINFIKQFVATGLSKDVQLIVPGFGSDQDVISSVGEQLLGVFDTAHWSMDLDNDANRKFVAAFEAEFKRLPSVFAAQGYDAALAIDGAVRDVKGKIEDKEAFRRAIKAAHFKSVRGDFKYNVNGMPIQTYYLRVIAKDSKGRIVNKKIATLLSNHGDAYAKDCKLK